jgi:hypothetical protein
MGKIPPEGCPAHGKAKVPRHSPREVLLPWRGLLFISKQDELRCMGVTKGPLGHND